MTSDHNLDKAAGDDWTKIPVHCAECGGQFLRKVRHQIYCDEHRHLGGAVIRPQEATSSKDVLFRAAGWLSEPAGESRASTRDLIERLARELTDTRAGLAACNQVMQQERGAHETSDRPPMCTGLELIRDGQIPQGMSPALFADRVLRVAAQLTGDPYKAVCQGGSGGKCTDPDCEKCWPEEPSENLTSRQHAARNALQGCTCGSDGNLHNFNCQLRREGDDGKGAVNGTG